MWGEIWGNQLSQAHCEEQASSKEIEFAAAKFTGHIEDIIELTRI